MNRRDFLKGILGLTGALALDIDINTAIAKENQPKYLWIARNGETLRLNIYEKSGYQGLRYLMRDVRANVQGFPHFFLAQRMAWIQAYFAMHKKLELFKVTSGLRTKATNNKTENAARNSAHLPNHEMVFHAVDFRLGNIGAKEIADVSKFLANYSGFGGTGLYVGRNFIHMDVMRKRTWSGK